MVGYVYRAWCFTFPAFSLPFSVSLGQTHSYLNKITDNHGIQEGHAQDGSRFVKERQLEQQSANEMLPVIPYVEPKEEKPADFSSTLSSTMPMAAVSNVVVHSRAPSLTSVARCSQETGKQIACGFENAIIDHHRQNAWMVSYAIYVARSQWLNGGGSRCCHPFSTGLVKRPPRNRPILLQDTYLLAWQVRLRVLLRGREDWLTNDSACYRCGELYSSICG